MSITPKGSATTPSAVGGGDSTIAKGEPLVVVLGALEGVGRGGRGVEAAKNDLIPRCEGSFAAAFAFPFPFLNTLLPPPPPPPRGFGGIVNLGLAHSSSQEVEQENTTGIQALSREYSNVA